MVKVRSRNAPSGKGESIGIVSQSTLNRLLQKPCPGAAPQKPSHTSAPPNKRFTLAYASAPYRTDPGHQRRSKVTRGGVRSRTHDTPSCEGTAERSKTETRLNDNVSGSVTDDMSVSHRRHLTEEWLQQSVVSECDSQCAAVTAECCHQLAVTRDAVCAGVDGGRLRKCEGEPRGGGCLTGAPQAGGDGADVREKLFLLQRDGLVFPILLVDILHKLNLPCLFLFLVSC